MATVILAAESARWVALRLMRHPATWLWVALLAAVWPTIAALTPVGLTTDSATEARAIYEVAFIACAVASLAALAIHLNADAFLAPLSPLQRATVEVSGHLAAGIVFVVPLLIAAYAVGAPTASFVPTRLPLGALLTQLHLAGLAIALSRVPLPRAALLAVLPALAWLLPALLPDRGGLWAGVRHVLDCARHLDFLAERPGSGAHRIADSLPIIGLLGIGLLLPRQLTHALRHPR